MKYLKNKLILAVCLLVMVASCKKDEIPPVPVLPPENAFSMDFSSYDSDKSVNLIAENWLYSSLNVAFFSVFYSSTMIIPAIAYSASFASTPTYIGDQTWQWSYEFPAIGSTYYATLNGITQTKGDVKWEMYIDKIGANGFTDFLWFEGSVKDSTSASWTIYENPTTPNKVIASEWKASADHKTYELKYTLVSTFDDDADSYIISGKDPAKELDRYYEIYRSIDESKIMIEWSSTIFNGRVSSPAYFNNSNWHCWNKYLIDDWCD